MISKSIRMSVYLGKTVMYEPLVIGQYNRELPIVFDLYNMDSTKHNITNTEVVKVELTINETSIIKFTNIECSDNKISFVINREVTINAGTGTLVVTVEDSTDHSRITSSNMDVIIEESPINEESIEPPVLGIYMTDFQDAITDAVNANNALLDTFADAQEVANTLISTTASANAINSQLGSKIATARVLDSNLTAQQITGNQLLTKLASQNDEANATSTSLQAKIDEGTPLNTSLGEKITNATALDASLGEKIPQADELNTSLGQVVAEGTNLKPELTNVTSSAKTAYGQLTSKVTEAQEALEDLNTGIAGANLSNYVKTTDLLNIICPLLFPVGTIIYLGSNINPNDIYPNTAWKRITGKYIVGLDESKDGLDTLNKTIGGETHYHTNGNLKACIGAINNDTGSLGYRATTSTGLSQYNMCLIGMTARPANSYIKHINHGTAVIGQTANASNYPPSIVKYMWERIETYNNPVIKSFTVDKDYPQPSGTKLTFKFDGTGEGTIKYKLLVQDVATNTWITIRDYSTVKTHIWTAGTAGMKNFYVEAKDSNGKTTRRGILGYEITRPLKIDFVASPESQQVSGGKVNLTTTVKGEGTFEYKFLVQDIQTNSWAVIKDYSSASSMVWTTGTAGTKNIYVDVKEINTGSVIRKAIEGFEVVTESGEVTHTFKVDKSSPQLVKTDITLTVVTTGTGNFEYKFLVEDISTNTWTVLRDYNSAKSVIWNELTAGIKNLYVDIKDLATNAVTRKSIEGYEITNTGGGTTTYSFTTDKVSPQSEGSSIKLTATVTNGSGTYQYKFLSREDTTGEWTVLQNYSTTNTCTWYANTAGSYNLYVDIKSDSSGEVNRQQITGYVIQTSGIQATTSISPESTVSVGNKVTLRVTVSTEGTYQYKFLVRDMDTDTWASIQDFSDSNTKEWTASKSGTKNIYVDIKDTVNNITVRKMIAENYIVTSNTAVPVISSFITDKSSPQIVGTQVTLTANATGSGNLQYKFVVQDSTGNENLLRDFSSSNTYTWTPDIAGNKTLYVIVKDTNENEVRTSIDYIISENEEEELITATFTTDKASPQAKGTPITLTATVTNGSGTYQYKFLVRDMDTDTWSTIQDFSDSNTKEWTAPKAGIKNLYVDIKDLVTNTVTRKSIEGYEITSTGGGTTIHSFTTDKKSPQDKGTPITLTVDATGSGNLQYKFLVQDSDGKWHLLRDFSSSNTYIWTPNSEGTKTLYVIVKDGNGNEVRTSIDYNILSTEPTVPVISSFTTNKSSPQIVGTPITLTANATGSGDLQYKFLVQDATGNEDLLRDFSSSNTYIWTPNSKGTKTLFAIVKDTNGNEVRKSMSYIISENEEETVETNYIIDDAGNPITDENDNNIIYKNS